MRSIANQWTEFEASVVPKDSPPIQRQEIRRAFYGGFHCALLAATEIAAEARASDDIGVTLIQRLHDECLRFGDDVQAGRA